MDERWIDRDTVCIRICTQTASWIDRQTKRVISALDKHDLGGERGTVYHLKWDGHQTTRDTASAPWGGRHAHLPSQTASIDTNTETLKPHIVDGTRVHTGFGKSLKTFDTASPYGPEVAQLRSSPWKLKTYVRIKIYANIDSIIITQHYHYYYYYS